MSANVTFRFSFGAGVDFAMVQSKLAAASSPIAIGRVGEFCYLRGKASTCTDLAVAPLERLPQGCEVFEIVTSSVEHAQALGEVLSGRGALGGIHCITRREATLLIEYIGDLFLLFDLIDVSGFATTRRAVVPLDDKSLISIASTLWRDSELTTERILECAAEKSGQVAA